MKPKHILIINVILILLICLVTIVARGQDYSQARLTEFLQTETTAIIGNVEQERVDMVADDLTYSFINFGETGIDTYFATADCSWYYGLDLYIHEDWYELLDAVSFDESSTFRDTGTITSAVRYEQGYFVVVIFSFP